MKCPQCKFVSSNKRDICPRCQFDLRPLKQALGLAISDPSASHQQLIDKQTQKPELETKAPESIQELEKQPVAKKAKVEKSSWLSKLVGAESALDSAPAELSLDELAPAAFKAEVLREDSATPLPQEEKRFEEEVLDEPVITTSTVQLDRNELAKVIGKASEDLDPLATQATQFLETETISPNVFDFEHSDTAALEAQLEEMVDGLVFKVEAVEESPAPVKSSSLESIELSLDDLEELEDTLEEDEAPIIPTEATLAPPSGDLVELTTELESLTADTKFVPIASDSPIAGDKLLEQLEKTLREYSEPENLGELTHLKQLVDELSSIVAELYGITPQEIILSKTEIHEISKQSSDELMPLEEELERELKALESEGLNFASTELEDNHCQEVEITLSGEQILNLEHELEQELDSLREEGTTLGQTASTKPNLGPRERALLQFQHVSLEEEESLTEEEQQELLKGLQQAIISDSNGRTEPELTEEFEALSEALQELEDCEESQLSSDPLAALWDDAEAEINETEEDTFNFEVISLAQRSLKRSPELDLLFNNLENEIEGKPLAEIAQAKQKPNVHTSSLDQAFTTFKKEVGQIEEKKKKLQEFAAVQEEQKRLETPIPAERWRRTFAGLVDLTCYVFVSALLTVTLSFSPEHQDLILSTELPNHYAMMGYLPSFLKLLLVVSVASTAVLIWARGQTIGQRIFDVLVVTREYTELSFTHAAKFALAQTTLLTTLALGSLLGLGKNKRLLQDRLAQTWLSRPDPDELLYQ